MDKKMGARDEGEMTLLVINCPASIRLGGFEGRVKGGRGGACEQFGGRWKMAGKICPVIPPLVKSEAPRAEDPGGV